MLQHTQSNGAKRLTSYDKASQNRVRTISKLSDCKFLSSRPHFIPTPRPRNGSTIAKGLAYQRKWTDQIKVLSYSCFQHRLFSGIERNEIEILPEQWFIYADSGGTGYAESDLIVVVQPLRMAFIFECKRTHNDRGLVQLGQLYSPLVQFLYPDFRIFGLLVCRNLDSRVNRKYLLPEISEWFSRIEESLISGEQIPLYSLCWRG